MQAGNRRDHNGVGKSRRLIIWGGMSWPVAIAVESGLPEEDLVEVGRYATAEQGAAHGLVVLATGQPYWLEETVDGFRLRVEQSGLAYAQRHLAAYDRERLRWPPPPIADPWTPRTFEFLTPLLWSATVLALFRFGPPAPAWIHRGVLDARAVFADGEVWRALTALFLHGDAAHVITNALSGLLVFPAVLTTFGRRRGWLLLLLGGIAGNLAVAAVNYPGPYTSLGASTAIFAGVGLFAGRAVRLAWRSRHPHRGRAIFAPLAAGATVLALYGTGAQRVDVGAHLTGFLAGVVLGFVAAPGETRRTAGIDRG